MVNENETKEQIKSDITLLTEVEDKKRKSRNKRIYILNGSLVAFLLVLGILPGILTGKWDATIPNLLGIFWLGFVTILELENSNLRWVSGMQQGLHDLERKEFDKLLEALRPENSMPKAPKVAKKGTK